MLRRIKGLTYGCVLLLVLSIILFFVLTKDRSMITNISFLFVLWSEIVLFCGLILIEKISRIMSQIIWRVGGGVIISIYSLIAFVISLVSIIIKKGDIKMFLLLQVMLFCLATVLILIIGFCAFRVNKKDRKVLEAENEIAKMLSIINLLQLDVNYKAYKTELLRIEEELKYSDTSTLVLSDGDLAMSLIKLEDTLKYDTEVNIHRMFDDISRMIQKRKNEVRTLKQGGY